MWIDKDKWLFMEKQNQAYDMLLNLPSALVVFSVFVIISFIFSYILKKISNKYDTRASEIFRLVSNSQKTLMIFIGVVMAISKLGFDVSALITGLGLTGFAIGLALKDAISNIVAGALIVIYRPFVIGDDIKFSDCNGRVSDINLRYVTVETEDGQQLIPNSLFLNTKIALMNKQNKGDMIEG